MTRLRLWLRALLFRQRLDREMREEMTTHLSRATERLTAEGMSADDARRAARLEFGPVTRIQEDARDVRGAGGIESILADLRFGFRHFRRRPISALTMIVVLALGIGVNTALFLLIPPNSAGTRVRQPSCTQRASDGTPFALTTKSM
jgi:putative ABC transport system permease protein